MDIGKPHRIMTPEEYYAFGFEGPHVIEWDHDGCGNLAWWPLEVVVECAKDEGRASSSGEAGGLDMKIAQGFGWVPDPMNPGYVQSASIGDYVAEIKRLRGDLVLALASSSYAGLERQEKP